MLPTFSGSYFYPNGISPSGAIYQNDSDRYLNPKFDFASPIVSPVSATGVSSQ